MILVAATSRRFALFCHGAMVSHVGRCTEAALPKELCKDWGRWQRGS